MKRIRRLLCVMFSLVMLFSVLSFHGQAVRAADDDTIDITVNKEWLVTDETLIPGKITLDLRGYVFVYNPPERGGNRYTPPGWPTFYPHKDWEPDYDMIQVVERLGVEIGPEANGDWTYVFEDMPKTVVGPADGKEYQVYYTVEEKAIPGYVTIVTTTETGFDIRNVPTETFDLNIHKVWDDYNDTDKLRPESINYYYVSFIVVPGEPNEIGPIPDELVVYPDLGQLPESYAIVPVVLEEMVTATADAEGNWDTVIKDCPKNMAYQNPETGDIELYPVYYVIGEESVTGYKSEVVAAEDGFTVTNSHNPLRIDINVKKIWNDNNDNEHLRPGSIVYDIYGYTYTYEDPQQHAEREPRIPSTYPAIEVKPDYVPKKVYEKIGVVVTPDENGNWDYIFEQLPGYYPIEDHAPTGPVDDNIQRTRIYYELVERENKYYTSEITLSEDGTGFTVTNTHEPETIELTAYKQWEDFNNAFGLRQDVTLHLNLVTPEGNVVLEGQDRTISKDAEGDDLIVHWTVPAYVDGKLAKYAVTEDPVDKYETVYGGSMETRFQVLNTLYLGKITFTKDVVAAEGVISGEAVFGIVIQYEDGRYFTGTSFSEEKVVLPLTEHLSIPAKFPVGVYTITEEIEAAQQLAPDKVLTVTYSKTPADELADNVINVKPFDSNFLTITNTYTDKVPDSGDNRNLPLYSLMTLVGLVGAACTFTSIKRKEEE